MEDSDISSPRNYFLRETEETFRTAPADIY